jgi:hypothetical protein
MGAKVKISVHSDDSEGIAKAIACLKAFKGDEEATTTVTAKTKKSPKVDFAVKTSEKAEAKKAATAEAAEIKEALDVKYAAEDAAEKGTAKKAAEIKKSLAAEKAAEDARSLEEFDAAAAADAVDITEAQIYEAVKSKSKLHAPAMRVKFAELGAKNVPTIDPAHYAEVLKFVESL